MKSLIAIVFAFLFSINAHAFTFRANAQVYVTNSTAQVTVYNSFHRAIICNGNARGVTVTGAYVYSYMNRVVIYPGMNGFLYVYSNGYPFVSATADIYCSTL